MDKGEKHLRIVAWGTYDLGKPRVRILLRGLRQNAVDVRECHSNVWRGIEDKSQVRGWREKLRITARWIFSYPQLLVSYLRQPGHDAVVVPYMGQFDILVLWPIAKLRGRPIVLDAFLSLYNTVVEDRRLIGKRNPIAYALYAVDWLACHAADLIIVDTNAHGDYFRKTFRLDPACIQRVFVGVEPDCFPPATPPARPEALRGFLRVLFYGQFIPLHGIDTVVRAAKLTETDGILWHLIGTGQEVGRIRRLVAELKPANLEWKHWVPYEELVQEIHSADVCLGIFGATEKAARVIPNKVFQVLASEKPLITADTPAVRELGLAASGVYLVPAGEPWALAKTLRRIRALGVREALPRTSGGIRTQLRPAVVVEPLVEWLREQLRFQSRRKEQ